jgi:hypothetical protein
MPGAIALKLRVLREEREPLSEGGGGACSRTPRYPQAPGERRAAPLHAYTDEDRQGLRRIHRGGGRGIE